MNTYHYTYLLVDLQPQDTRRFYIGVRTSNCLPKEDDYYGSSIYLPNKNQLKKIILETWPNRKLAEKHEEELHALFDVKTHEEFYNRSNATERGFTTLGNKEAIKKAKQTRNSPEGQIRWKIGVEKRRLNKNARIKRSKSIKEKYQNDPSWVKSKTNKRTDTVNTEIWKETTGLQVRENMRKTFNDPTWKDTVGKEKSKKISLLKKERDKLNRKLCPHCGKSFDPANYGKYHGNKCKLNK